MCFPVSLDSRLAPAKKPGHFSPPKRLALVGLYVKGLEVANNLPILFQYSAISDIDPSPALAASERRDRSGCPLSPAAEACCLSSRESRPEASSQQPSQIRSPS